MDQQVLAAQENFLLPNGTFWGELIIFAIVLVVIWRFVLPPVQKALKDREDMVSKEVEQSRKAAETFEQAQVKYNEALAEARAESAAIRDEARADGQRILDDLRQRAQAEADQIVQRGDEQLAAQRAQVLAELRTHVGELSTSLAGRVVGGELAPAARGNANVDRILGELEGNG
ncbi:MAG TPA: F0F1 ATP synthase subunit B [Kutzneria sp.]|jgi:F-type H+-transporting ATPase subunit b|nr:F0F1 ATP synthase subunit B [Kutzneria sp.]